VNDWDNADLALAVWRWMEKTRSVPMKEKADPADKTWIAYRQGGAVHRDAEGNLIRRDTAYEVMIAAYRQETGR
jgi:hypothetical protein